MSKWKAKKPATEEPPQPAQPQDFASGNAAEAQPRNIFGHANATSDWWDEAKPKEDVCQNG